MKNTKIIGVLVLTLMVLSACSSEPKNNVTVERAMEVAQCLNDKGARFFGAFWCPHCIEQKEAFGTEAGEILPYFECDPRGENAVPETCKAEDIQGYPAWLFSDGSKITGAKGVEELADWAECDKK